MGKFIIRKRANGKLVFDLLDGNDQVILTSEEYETRVGCENGILSVQTNSHLHNRYERMPSADGQQFFVLRSSNGEIIGTSELYRTAEGLMAGIESVMENGQMEEVEDQSI